MYIHNEFSPSASINLQCLINIAKRHNVGILISERHRNSSSGLSLCVCKSNKIGLDLKQYIEIIIIIYNINANKPINRFLLFKLSDNNLSLHRIPIKKYPSANIAVLALHGAMGLPEIRNIDDKHSTVIIPRDILLFFVVFTIKVASICIMKRQAKNQNTYPLMIL